MRMKPKTLAGLIILFLFLALIPPVSGNGWPEEQTRHIIVHPPATGTDGDWFVTESGLGFSSSLVTVLDPNMDIYGYLFFKDIKLNSYFYLENATLRLHTASTLDFDNESSFTIYGINDYRYFGMGDWGYGSPAEIMSAPLTSAYVNYNSSQFYGHQWWDIDVSNIVQELKSNPWYEGPGLSFYDPGDYMAFIILGSGGHDSRWFYDVSVGNGFEAQLHLHWDFNPPPPSDPPPYYEYVEDYGNHSIWMIPGGEGYSLEPIEYTYLKGVDPHPLSYANISDPAYYTVNASIDPAGQGYNGPRYLVRESNGTLHTIYQGARTPFRLHISKSDDNGITWNFTDEFNGQRPCMAIDSQDGLHVVFEKGTPSQIYYTYRKKDNSTWSTPFEINPSTYYQNFAVIALDSENYIHCIWSAYTDANPDSIWIYYSKYTGLWSTPIAVNVGPANQFYPSIAIDSENSIHVTWRGSTTIYYRSRNTEWGPQVELASGGYEHSTSQIAVDQDDLPYVVFSAFRQPITSYLQIYETHYNGSDWSTVIKLSTGAGMSSNDQRNPSLAVDSNNTVFVVWTDETTTYKGWTRNRTEGVWSGLKQIQSGSYSRDFNLRWATWPKPSNATYFVVDANGTIVEEGLDSLDDAQDWIDTYDTDPEDPDPAGEWSTGPGGETGAFTRFRMRLWFLIIGFGCLFGPVLFFAWRRPSGYYLMAGSIVMLIGLGLLMSIAQV